MTNPPNPHRATALRKDQHLDVALRDGVSFSHTTTMFDDVRLVHNCLPELDLDAIDTSVHLFGKRLRVPIVIAAMTGGTERAARINEQLARVAQQFGCGIGLGSQRSMLETPELARYYTVRHVAPSVLLLGNIGVIQAREAGAQAVARLASVVGADAMCVHANPAQEIVQPEGDRDFRGGLPTITRLVEALELPLIVKETGCGIAYTTACKLYDAGVRHVDVSGAGGTSWVAVETERATGVQQAVGLMLREWGIPTAVSVAWAKQAKMDTIVATGGIRTGLDVAKAIAIGASAAGLAKPVLQALEQDGQAGALAFLQQIEAQLRAVMLLVGADTIAQLRSVPRIYSPAYQNWIRV